MQYVQNKLKSLFIPFCCYSGIVMLLMQGIGILDISNLFTYGWGGYALWFVPVLFGASIVVRASYCVSNTWIRRMIIIGFFVTSYFLSTYGVYLPWQLSTVPYAAFLVILGHEMAKGIKLIEATTHYWDIILLALLTFIICCFCQLDMASNQIIPIIPLTIGAISGTLMTFRLSVWIERKIKWGSCLFQHIGKETFVVVAFSQIIIIYINHFATINPALKYSLLAIGLIALKYAKGRINRLLGIKIL